MGGSQVPAREQQLEKTLGQIPRLFSIVSLAAGKSVQGPPVNAAKFFEGFFRGRGFTLGGRNQAPMSRRECSRFSLGVYHGTDNSSRLYPERFSLMMCTLKSALKNRLRSRERWSTREIPARTDW